MKHPATLLVMAVLAAAAAVAPMSVAHAVAAPPVVPSTAPLSVLWEPPTDLSDRDLYRGPWGEAYAPDPGAVYTFERPKNHGVNPGVVVRDPLGREWHVKQSARGNLRGAEGPVEVVLSRVLSAIGYHQPPVYYLPSFLMTDGGSPKPQPGGRFRLSLKELKDRGDWAWLDNPFTQTRELHGLLVILLIFNSSDVKDANNTVYEVRTGAPATQWLVVRDLGTALGETGRTSPMRSNPVLLGKQPLIAGLSDGFVRFHYHGLHQELFDRRITIDDVRWAGALLSQLSDRQWHDAFRAGGYPPILADRFIAALRSRIAEAASLSPIVATAPSKENP